MAAPRQNLFKKRQNAIWLMNAASLAVAMGVANQFSKSNPNRIISLVSEVKAADYFYAGGTELKSGPFGFWSGTTAKANGTAADWSTASAGFSNGSGTNPADNIYFGSSLAIGAGLTWGSTINLGSSNITASSWNILSGASSYTFFATSAKKFTIGLSTQTQAAISNNSSSAITFNVSLAAQGGQSSSSACVFVQNTASGSLIFGGIGTQSASSYNLNPYSYDWAIATGSTAAQAKVFAAQGASAQSISISDGNSGSRYLKLTGIGTITVAQSIGDAFRGNMGSGTSPYRSNGVGNLIITNTGTTNLNGWNTYSGTTTIGDGTAAGGTVVVGNPYAFGGNRLVDVTAPTDSVSTSAYRAGTVATGFSINTQAFGVVTLNSGFSIDLNGTTMVGANALTMNGAGASGTGVIKNTSTNAATYAGYITLSNTSTMSTSFGNITLSGGLNTSSRTLTIDGVSNTYITGPITGISGGRIQKTGSGVLTLSGVNTLAGTLKVVTGNVVVTSPDALSTVGTNSILDTGASGSDTGNLVLTGGLANSNAYRMATITPGGNLNISTVNGNSTLTFDALTGSGQSGSVEKRLSVNAGVNVIIQGTFDLVGSTAASNRNFIINGDGNLTFNGVVRNNASGTPLANGYKGGLNKNTGNGILTLNGANTFDLGVIVGSGTINLGSAENPGVSGPLGSSGLLSMNGGYLQYSVNNQYDYSGRFNHTSTSAQKYNVDTNGQTVTWASDLTSVGGILNKNGLGTLILSGNNTYDGGTTLAGGVVRLDNSNSIGSTGTISFTGGVLQFTASNTTDYSARFSTAASQAYNLDTNGQSVALATSLTSVGGSFTKTGNGTLTLSGANSYSGNTNINQGQVDVTAANILSSSSLVSVSSGATLNLNSNNQTLKGLAGAGVVSIGTATLTIGEGSGSTFSGDITGDGNIIKSGAGTQTFSAPLSYKGSTSINAGVLKVNNNLTSSTVNVASDATLEGKGTIAGQVTVSSGGIINAGDTALADVSRGALTVSALTLSGNAVINLANVNTNSDSSILNIGSLSALGGAGSITINISNTTQLADNSVFTLLKYSSLDDFTAFKLGTVTGTYNRQIKSIINDTTNNFISLVTTGDTLKWSGESSLTPQWTTATGNLNWKLSSSGDPADYLAGDIISFDDTASIFVVTIAEDVSPNGITFSNDTNYTINSADATSFGITGGAALTKSGLGRVDINAPLKINGGLTVNNGTIALNNSGNTFTGNINLNGGGNLELGASGAAGTSNSLTFGSGATGKLTLKGNNATLSGLFNNSGSIGTPVVENGSSTSNSTLTLNIISGNDQFDGILQDGSSKALLLNKSGSGNLILTADNTFTGLTTISAGSLQLGNGGAIGLVGGDISVGASGTLNLNRTDKLSYSKIFSGSGVINLKTGQLELLASNTFTGSISLFNGTTLTIGSGGRITSSVAITNNGLFEYNNSASTFALGAMSGTGTLSILANTVTQSGTNTITGSVNIAAGSTYFFASGGSLSSASAIANNGTLSFGTRATDFTLSLPMTGSGSLISNVGLGRTLFLTGNNNYTGTTTITSGFVNVGNGGGSGLLGAGGVSIASGAELILSKASDVTLYGGLSGLGRLTLSVTGNVILDSNSPINIGGELKFGTTAGSSIHTNLDLTNASATVGTLKVQTDATTNPTAFTSIIIGSEKSLNVGGLVTIGLDNGSSPTTNLTMSGNGTLNIGTSSTPTNANVNIGASISASKINYVNWDMSALANLNMYLGTGTFNIGADVNSTGGTSGSGSGTTVKLASTSNISASTLLMDSVDGSKIFTLSLGSGLTTMNVDTLTVSGANTRSTSVLNFNSGNGSIVLRNKAGNGRTTLNVQSATNSTGNNQIGSVDFSGHSADLLLGTVTVGSRVSLIGSGAGYGSGYLAFDTGTFDATTLNIANKSHNGTAVSPSLIGKTPSSTLSGNLVGLVSFGGGTVVLGSVDVGRHAATNVGGTVQGLVEFLGSNTSTVGAVTLATANTSLVSGTSSATASLNVADGTVSVASISGASATANTNATANVNVSGGLLTLGGNRR